MSKPKKCKCPIDHEDYMKGERCPTHPNVSYSDTSGDLPPPDYDPDHGRE